MKDTSEVVGVLLYFARNLLIICGVCMGLALGIASYNHFTKGSPVFSATISILGILGLVLMIIGAFGVASAPGKTVSRGQISRTHVQELKTLRPGPNPWFGIGLSAFVSGIILSTLAFALT